LIRFPIPQAVGSVAAFAVLAQGQPVRPAFEVAAVKASAPPQGDGIRVTMGGTPGRLDYTNASLKNILARAYDVREYQISGPEWLSSARFDIAAKLPAEADRQQIPLMLQRLLEDRFKLVARRERRETPVYALVAGKNGPKLKPAEKPEDGSGCSTSYGWVECHAVPMPTLAFALARLMDRPVVDMSGIDGKFDLSLRFAPEAGAAAPRTAEGEAPDPAAGPSLFTALQETLGLKLEPRKAPLDHLVIERVEKTPTEN
jgi:uncharacterized protein (TIGR03435 family)